MSSIQRSRSPLAIVPEHAQQAWADRANCDRVNLRAAWHEAEPIDYPSAQGCAYARYHRAGNVVLIAEFGTLKTCTDLDDRPYEEQRYVRKQMEARS